MYRLSRKVAKRIWIWHVRRSDQRQRRRLGMESHELKPELWDSKVGSNGHLMIGGCDVVDLAEKFGTPLVVADKGRLRRNYTTFLESFRKYLPNVEIDYSYKTNPLPGVLRALHEFGTGAEVISPFELWLALELGVPPERITFNGPAKTEEGLALAVSRGVRVINVDNLSEIDTIQREASKLDRIQALGVRVVTSVGWSSQFGFNINDGAALAAFEHARHCPNVEPCGLHLHLGTGIKDADIYSQALQEVLEFARALRDRLNIAIRLFDFGGGFGVPTVRSLSATDFRLIANGYSPTVMDITASPALDTYGSMIAGLFQKHVALTEGRDTTLILEPGRALTSSAQTLLLRVLAIKPAHRCDYNVILDGGKNVAMPPGFEFHEVLPASKMLARHHGRYDLFGPLCHPGDVLCVGKRMPQLEPGDIVAVMDAGAYFIPNEMNFSNPRSAAVMVEAGKAKLIRRRESFEDVVRRDEPSVPAEQIAGRPG